MNQSNDLPGNDTGSVLVIHTGPIGAFVQALEAFSAIRMHHDGVPITLVTHGALTGFSAVAPYFDRVEEDSGSIFSFAAKVKRKKYRRVYDLDNSVWTRRVFTLSKTWRQHLGLRDLVPWNGYSKLYTLCADATKASAMHQGDRYMLQLEAAGIEEHPPASLAWVSRAVGTFALPLSLSEPFVLLAIDPGGSNQVQWPPARYADMAEIAFARGERPVVIGEQDYPEIVEAVCETVPEAVSLCGEATYIEMVFLAWAARAAVGTDNGLMHLLAAAGCKSVVLYDPGSDAALTGHRGPDVMILRRHDLASITAAEVMQALNKQAIA